MKNFVPLYLTSFSHTTGPGGSSSLGLLMELGRNLFLLPYN